MVIEKKYSREDEKGFCKGCGCVPIYCTCGLTVSESFDELI